MTGHPHTQARLALLAKCLGFCAASYLILRLSAHGAQWLNPQAMRMGTRPMGLLLIAIALQFSSSRLRR